MRFQTIEIPRVTGRFPTGSTVTISVYDITSGAIASLSSASCVEIGTTGVYYWDFSNLVIYPTSLNQFYWVMTDTISEVEGEIIIGGYPDQLLLMNQDANIIYVSKNGNDSNDGRSYQTSFATIGAAISLATSGDLIRIFDGIYLEDVDVTENNVRIEGIGSVIILTLNSVPTFLMSCSSCRIKNLIIFGGNGTSGFEVATGFSGNFIENCSVAGISGPGVNIVSGAENIYVRDLSSFECDEGVNIEGNQCVLDSCFVIGNGTDSYGYRISGTGNMIKECISQVNPSGSFELQVASLDNNLIRCIKGGLSDGAITDAGTNNQIINLQDVSQISSGQSLMDDLKSVWDDTQKLPTNPADRDDCLLIETKNEYD